MQNQKIYNFEFRSHFEKMTGKWLKFEKTDFWPFFGLFFENFGKTKENLENLKIALYVESKDIQF